VVPAVLGMWRKKKRAGNEGGVSVLVSVDAGNNNALELFKISCNVTIGLNDAFRVGKWGVFLVWNAR